MTSHARDIENLLDRTALQDLLVFLVACLDAKDFEAMAKVYTADAILCTPDGQVTGASEIIDVARRNHEQFAATQHFVSGITCVPTGADATVTADVLAVFVIGHDASSAHRMLGSRYNVRAERTDHGWRYVEHTITPVWSHATQEAAARAVPGS
ncbi:nuclear transport factor 2 family protein [Nocardia salmonicida]|uniref:nuclear transport factor 2 family protein n=1 Tax=Nocardia salmonicida TaxID=53431 RepID=UPI00340A687D